MSAPGHRLFSLVVFLLLVSAGCQCGGSVTVECLEDGDCPSGVACVEGVCRGGSGDGGDTGGDAGACAVQCGGACCPAGHRCEAGVCRVDCAEEETRCGAAPSETCCAGAELCYLGACVTPGADCTGSSQCPAGQYCDPAIDKCLPESPSNDCEFRPDAGFAPSTLWNSVITQDAYTQVMMTPVVIDVDLDGTPEVLANYFSVGQGYNGPGVMRALSGATGEVLWTTQDVAADHVHPPSSIAAADLDGDGPGRIAAVTGAPGGGLIAFDGRTGQKLWESRTTAGVPEPCNPSWGGPSIADLDGDGLAEVVCGLEVFDHTGVQEWSGPAAAGSVGPLTVVADLDLDGKQDVTDGVRALRHDGTPLGWTGTGFGGLLAVGDFTVAGTSLGRDGSPELVSVGQGQLALVEGATGDPLIAPSALPSWNGTDCVVGGGQTGNGGPPTVADFDGDGAPEIGVANLSCYTVFEVVTSGSGFAFSVLWSKKVQDQSSSVTGSSVFDFDGDQKAEVVYADEVALHVFEGGTGEEIFSRPHCSGTTYEYPVIVDVNGNGRADIVISENTYAAGGLGCASGATAGIHVFRDANDNWVNTRPIWNQHTYHVTNVCDGRDLVCGGQGAPWNYYGRVPQTEPRSWAFTNAPSSAMASPLNNYRQNVQGEGLFNAADLAVTDIAELTGGCPQEITLTARVVNQGALGLLAGIPVAFYREGMPRTLLGVALTTQKLLPGQSEVVQVTWTAPAGHTWPMQVVVVADDDGSGAGTSSECREDNNGAGPVTVYCGGIG